LRCFRDALRGHLSNLIGSSRDAFPQQFALLCNCLRLLGL
jgi:hypothetical protein